MAFGKGIQKNYHSPTEFKRGIHPSTEFKKGHIPWNKGTKGKLKAWNKGIPCREETKIKLRLSHKGKKSSRKGKTYEEFYGQERAKILKKKLYLSHKNKLSPKKGKTYEDIFGKKRAKEVKERIRITKKKEFQDPHSHYHNKEIQERRIKNSLKALMKRPTKLEQKFINFFKKHKISFNYCGDGSLLIGFKNPDFVESNGKKICIEVCNKVEKSIKRKGRSYHSWQEYEKQRIKYFNRYGWKSLVLWQEELKDEEKMIKKIMEGIKP